HMKSSRKQIDDESGRRLVAREGARTEGVQVRLRRANRGVVGVLPDLDVGDAADFGPNREQGVVLIGDERGDADLVGLEHFLAHAGGFAPEPSPWLWGPTLLVGAAETLVARVRHLVEAIQIARAGLARIAATSVTRVRRSRIGGTGVGPGAFLK